MKADTDPPPCRISGIDRDMASRHISKFALGLPVESKTRPGPLTWHCQGFDASFKQDSRPWRENYISAGSFLAALVSKFLRIRKQLRKATRAVWRQLEHSELSKDESPPCCVKLNVNTHQCTCCSASGCVCVCACVFAYSSKVISPQPDSSGMGIRGRFFFKSAFLYSFKSMALWLFCCSMHHTGDGFFLWFYLHGRQPFHTPA